MIIDGLYFVHSFGSLPQAAAILTDALISRASTVRHV